jgi:hypothetical protein
MRIPFRCQRLPRRFLLGTRLSGEERRRIDAEFGPVTCSDAGVLVRACSYPSELVAAVVAAIGGVMLLVLFGLHQKRALRNSNGTVLAAVELLRATQEARPSLPSAARLDQFFEGVAEAVDLGRVGWRAGFVAARRLLAHCVGRVHGDGLVEALVDVPAGVVGKVLADIDDDGNVWLGEGEEQAPFSPEVDDAQPVDAVAREAIAGGVTSDAL